MTREGRCMMWKIEIYLEWSWELKNDISPGGRKLPVLAVGEKDVRRGSEGRRVRERIRKEEVIMISKKGPRTLAAHYV